MRIDLNKTLEQLDKQEWPKPEVSDITYLVSTCYRLRKKPLKDFTTEDLRVMIGQNINLEYLVPLAIEQLKENILAEGHFYEGDLLNSVLTSEKEYWRKNKNNGKIICELFEQNEMRLKAFDTTKEIKHTWYENFEKFKKLMD